MNDYFQGPARRVIQHHINDEWQDKWIAWNWRTLTWDDKSAALNEDGE